ncbi:MAG: FAD-dependent oxidoreductase, partial [Solirubrobacterales bacterium]
TGISSQTIEPVPDSQFELDVDLVLVAIGFTNPEPGGAVGELGLELDKRGNIRDTAFKTNVNGVYTAGDCRVGASLVVTAIADGRRCARVVDKALRA